MIDTWQRWHNTLGQAMQCSECRNKITKESNVDPEKIEITDQSTSDVFVTTTKDFDGDIRFYVNEQNGDFAFINREGAKQIIEAFTKIFELDFSVVTVQKKAIVWR